MPFVVVLLTIRLRGFMRELTAMENLYVSGGTEGVHHSTNYDEFWTAYFQGAGWGAGYLSSIPIALGMATYALVYYGVYTPIYHIVAGVYDAFTFAGNSLYAGGASVVSTVTGK